MALSLFQALRQRAGGERKKHAKSWRAGKGKGKAPVQALPSFLPFRSLELAKCRSEQTVRHTTQTQVGSILLRVFQVVFCLFTYIQVPTDSNIESGLPVESLALAVLSCVYLLFHPTATFPPSVLLLNRSKAGILVLKK